MKKIISALALASLTFGAAFADASISLNYRSQGFIYGTDTVNNKNDFFSNLGYGGPQDDVKFTASSDIATVELTIAPNPSSRDASGTTYLYDAFVNVGNWEIGAGVWKNGKSSGAYQLKTDADNANIGGDSFAAYKLGSMFKQQTTFIDDIVNFGGGGTTYAGYATWGSQLGKAKLVLTGSLISSSWDKEDTKSVQLAGYGVKADIMYNNNWDHQFVIKAKDTSNVALGYHVQPYFIPNTGMTVGGTLGIVDSKVNDYNVDFRVRWLGLANRLSVTFFTNYSWVQTATAIGKTVGAYGTYASDSASGYTALGQTITAQAALWTELHARYKLNGNWFAFGSVGQICGLDDFEHQGMQIHVAPGIQYFFTGKSSFMTFVRLGLSQVAVKDATDEDMDVVRSVTIPFIIRIRF